MRRSASIRRFQSTLPAWGATNIPNVGTLVYKFQSTLPAWGATGYGKDVRAELHISIHAPRVGSDAAGLYKIVGLTRFQSTLPAWGATTTLSMLKDTFEFQSTLPAWGATHVARLRHHGYAISIHAPRVGSD